MNDELRKKQAARHLAELIREANAPVAKGVITSVSNHYRIPVRELKQALREHEGIRLGEENLLKGLEEV